MGEVPIVVASAVLLPEIQDQSQPPTPSLKRRQSSVSSPDSKRPRLSQDEPNRISNSSAASPPQAGREQRMSERRKSGQLEERKRGQRLFGALLGTLSQSSSSTAQKRRTDIEKKQQTKLKLQTEEENEKKKAKLDALMEVRRREQKKYDRQSMQIRHSNLLSQAHFLRTKAEPRLYYKPWELLPADETKIKDQVKETEALIDQEISQYDIDHLASPKDHKLRPHQEVKQESKEGVNANLISDGKETDTHSSDDHKVDGADSDDVTMLGASPQASERPEPAKDTGDDGGEVVEGDEDTVIY